MTTLNQPADGGSDSNNATSASSDPATALSATSTAAATTSDSNLAATASGTRDPSQTPFSSTSFFNLPLGTGAQWTYNGQLASANVFVNANGNYNEPIYASSGNDPFVTVYDSNTDQGGAPVTYQLHIPSYAQPSGGSDSILNVDDTTTGTWYSFGNFQWTSPTTANAAGGSAEPDNGSGIEYNNGNDDEGVGTITGSDLAAGTIDHMLRMELPTDMLASYSSTPGGPLAPNAWPRTTEDYYGPYTYTGTVDFGVTVGIPDNAVEPGDIASSPGANMLWQALQDHGAEVRDSGGGGNTVTLQTDQNVQQGNPLIQEMEQYGGEIMSYTQILANQGPNSVNGGGDPVVPLDPPLSDDPGSTSATVAATTASSNDATTTDAASSPVTIDSGTASETVSQSQVSVVASGGDHMLFLSGYGDSINLSGGAETITDTGGGNTYILPAGGNGTDTFTSNILNAGDTLDLSAALAATGWDGTAASLSNYVNVTDSANGTTVSIAPSSNSTGVPIATIAGVYTDLSGILAHAIT